MANLPNKSFLCNFNARDYDPTTRTIPRTSGQTLAQDMVFKKSTSTRYTNGPTAITQYDDHISFSAGTYSSFIFTDGGSNPFNITSSNNNLTVIIKYYRNKDWTDPIYPTSPGTDVIMNRANADNTINFFMRCYEDTNNGKVLQFNGAGNNSINWVNHPVIEVVRMSGFTTTIMNLTDNIIGEPFTFVQKSNASNATKVGFFGQNYSNSSTDFTGCIGGDFYWVYISREVLTDDEIQQVIKYNEGIDFELSSTGSTVSRSAGSVSVGITSELNFSASTSANWVSISPATGDSGTTSVTINYAENTGEKRTGIITFTNSDNDEIIYTLVQNGVLFPIDNQYLNGNVINKEYQGSTVVNKAFLNGNVLVHRLTGKLTLSANSLTFGKRGGESGITVSSPSWSATTTSNWIGLSPASGSGTGLLTVSADTNSVEEQRTGTVVVTDGVKTKTISITQDAGSPYALPDKSFAFNYNAKDYNSETYIIPNNDDATMQVDMLLTGTSRTGITVSDDHIFIPVSTQFWHNFSSTSVNPLNVTSSNNNLTFVFKAKYIYNNIDNDTIRGNFFRNQDNNINWVVRFGTRENYPTNDTRISLCHNNSTANYDIGLSYTCGDTITAVVKIDNGVFSIKNIGTGESTTPVSITNKGGYGNASARIFTTYTGDFYWMYCSREVLTDAEIQDVVDYNNNY